MAGEVTPGLRALLARQQCFAVEYWGHDSEHPDYRDRDTADLADAHVASSAVRETWNKPKPQKDGAHLDPSNVFDLLLGFEEYQVPKHVIVIDVDHPAHLVDSSTPGHSHLYVEIPPVEWDKYVKWLEASAEIGLLSPGYVNACITRGHSDVRLPWIRKGEPGDIPLPWTGKDFFCCRCHREPQEIEEYRDQAQQQKDEGVVNTKTGGRQIDASEPAEVNDFDVQAWVWHNEGTLNRENGLFACTACYIAMGMPSGPRGWTPHSYEAEPQDPNVPDGPSSPPENPVVPVVDMSPLTAPKAPSYFDMPY